MSANGCGAFEFPNETIWSYLKRQLKQSPSNTVCLVQTETEQSLTASKLISQTEATARGFKKWGIREGQVVSMFCPNVMEYLVAYMGLTAVGGIMHLANWMFKHEELRYQINLCESVAVLTVPSLVSTVEKAIKGLNFPVEIIVIADEPVQGYTLLSEITALGNDGQQVPELENPRATPSTIFFSSGTTGYPKGVEHTHGSVVASLQQLVDIKYQDRSSVPGQQDIVLCFLPFFHIYSMAWVVLGSLIKNRQLVLMSKFDISRYMALIEKYKVNFLHIVPAVAIQMVNFTTVNSYDVSHVRSIFSAAAPLSKEIQGHLCRLFKLDRIEQGYGMTELSGTHTTFKEVTKYASVGLPHPGVEQKVVDYTTGEEMQPYQEGELRVRSPSQMTGYWRNPEATSAMLDEEGWVRTGDLAYIDEEGYLFITDRLKDIIRYKGEQVPPAEMEDLILSHPAVADVGVVGIPDDEAGELPKAFVVKKSGLAVTEKEIYGFVAERVSGCKKLRGGVSFVEKIPRNASGKILRRDLRDQNVTESH